MSKILEELLLNKITEMYDGNAYISGDGEGDTYIQRLLKARRIDAFDDEDDDNTTYGETSPEDLYAELRFFSHHNEDEITITYPDGQYITLDKLVVKEILANISAEDIEIASTNLEYFHALIHKMYDEVVTIPHTEEDSE